MSQSLYTVLSRLKPQKTLMITAARYKSAWTHLTALRFPTRHFLHCHVQSALSSRRLTASSSSSSHLYPDNILRSPLMDIDIPTNVSFHEFIFSKCDQYKDSLAVEDFWTGRRYTYKQLKEKAVKVASGLNKLGYRKGDVLVASSPNTIDITVLMLACAATGIWFCPANPAYTAKELARQMNHCEAVVLVVASAVAGTAQEALKDREFPNKIKDTFVFGETNGFQPFQHLLDDDGKSFPDVDINPLEDVYILPYSSGTTGLPKGVMLTHYNCLSNCLQVRSSIPITTEDHCLGLLPQYHIYGMTVVQFTILLDGASVTYLPKFEPETFLTCMQEKKITTAHIVPPLIVFLAKHPLVSKYDLTSLKQIICGAAPLGINITNECMKRFTHGVTFNQAYGMTELSPVCNVDITATAGSIGHLVANTRGKIVDIQTNRTLGPEEEGEYCIKGPQIMKGYYKNQKATDEMIEPEGWLHTGDIGYFRKDGLVFIHDRLKELIKYKGFQVAPAELEALLLAHHSVQDVAVIGVPDESAGELPKAFVVKKPGSSVSEEEIITFVEEKVTSSKRLRGGVQFIDEIPKNPSGKILRRVLRTKFL